MNATEKILYVFDKLNRIFQDEFVKTFSASALTESSFHNDGVLTDIAKIWLDELDNFPMEKIERAIQSCKVNQNLGMPTLTKFVHLCGMEPPPKVFKAALESDELIEHRKEQYKTGLANLRKILKGNN